MSVKKRPPRTKARLQLQSEGHTSATSPFGCIFTSIWAVLSVLTQHLREPLDGLRLLEFQLAEPTHGADCFRGILMLGKIGD